MAQLSVGEYGLPDRLASPARKIGLILRFAPGRAAFVVLAAAGLAPAVAVAPARHPPDQHHPDQQRSKSKCG
jgi:hypothetical protein